MKEVLREITNTFSCPQCFFFSQTKFFFSCLSVVLLSCHSRPTLFEELPSSKTGVTFTNKVEENDKYNMLEYMNLYTGAGVAAGDVNNDGLTDLYFSGNETSGRLYINKGNMQFEDVTAKAGLITDRWCTGVTMVDINNDGWLDIYVNVAGSPKWGSTANLLYINQHNGTFKEEAEQYGMADTRLTMNASFLDYDKDGDLDLFLITNPADEMISGVNVIHDRMVNGESKGTDILYRNNGNNTFTDVSKEAGILEEGYSLGCAVSDVNGDGYPDIYVSNDFLTTDILYINNRNGTFSDKTKECLPHTSFASMGNDIADFNNDALPDICTLDMLPEDNYRRKMIIPAAGYDKFQLAVQKGYEPQYTRNALQLNNGNNSFSDIAFLSGVSSTDWSWAALFGDYDNDGDKDLMITNGFYRNLGDLDYITYQARLQNPMGKQDAKREEKLKAIKELTNVPLQNYLFENNGNLSFTKRSDDWGFTQKGFSNGACYADLDNDGDLELIINCFNSEARIYENHANELTHHHYLTISLQGDSTNIQGIGAKLWLYDSGRVQYQEFYPSRGFESCMEPRIHFGLGNRAKTDSLVVEWTDGKRQTLRNVSLDKAILVKQTDAVKTGMINTLQNEFSGNRLFTDITGKDGLSFTHEEPDFVDFKVQPLMPHMLSKEGPGIAVADINGDGKDDFFIGNGGGAGGSLFMQDDKGNFLPEKLPVNAADNMGALFFDADSDGDNDLYIVNGGTENNEGSPAQQDGLYINDGKGNFTYDASALPETTASGSCVIACDYDKDGDLDLFVGGRVVPGSYPLAAQSYLLRNDGGRFTDMSALLPQGGKMGMVTAALWSDYDNDGWRDLVICGEFMPLIFIRNRAGVFDKNPLIVSHSSGWWNSITAGDFDEDGDIDYIAGNLGLNTRLKASEREPLCIYAKDFDKNGRLDPVMCYYVQGSNYIYATRDEMIKQINSMRGRFKSYDDYASAGFGEAFTKEELHDAVVVKSECFESSYFENKGNGNFERKPLPVQCQFAPVYGMITGDYNNDGFPDVLLSGNSYATEASTGRYDAMSGVLLAGNGKGDFTAITSGQTGFAANGDTKGIAELSLSDNSRLLLVANNSAPLKAYHVNSKTAHVFVPSEDDAYFIATKTNGHRYRQELYCGSGYLSSSTNKIFFPEEIAKITVYDTNNKKREILFSQP